MKNIPRTSILLAGLLLALMPADKAAAQTQYSQPPPDEITVRQARRDIVSASKYAYVFEPPRIIAHFLEVNSSSIVFTLDSIEFDATYKKATKKNGTKHFLIDLKDVSKVTSKFSDQTWCVLATESETEYMIKDNEAVRYHLYFDCDRKGTEKNAESMQRADRFAKDLNRLHAFALSHPAGLGDLHQQAAEWRALTAKPPLPEEVRVRRLLAEDAVKNQKPIEALNDYEIGLEFYPTWPEGHFNAALIAAELGDFASAVEHMQSYLELVPNASDAQAARDQITIWQHKAGQ